AFALVPKRGKPVLFIDRMKISGEASRLAEFCTIADISTLPARLAALGEKGRAVWVDPATVPSAVVDALRESGATLVEKSDPVLVPKSRKNAVEIDGMREAHRLDAVAMAK